MSVPTSPVATGTETCQSQPRRKLPEAEILNFVEHCQLAPNEVAVKIKYEIETELVQHRGYITETTAKQFTFQRQNRAGGPDVDVPIKFGVGARAVYGLVLEQPASAPTSIQQVLQELSKSQETTNSISQAREDSRHRDAQAREDARIADAQRREDARAAEFREFEAKRIAAAVASEQMRTENEQKRADDFRTMIEAIKEQSAEAIKSAQSQVTATEGMVGVLKKRDDLLHVAVSTHADTLQHSLHSEAKDLRLSLPHFTLPPYNVGTSFGYTTQEFIRMYDLTVDETVKILAFSGTGTAEGELSREKLMTRLEADPEAKKNSHWHRVRWITENKLDSHAAFFLAFESMLLTAKLPQKTAANLRLKLLSAICAPANTTKESEAGVAGQGLRSTKKESKGVFVSLSCAPSGTTKSPNKGNIVPKENKWRTTGGRRSRVKGKATRRGGAKGGGGARKGGGGALEAPSAEEEEEEAPKVPSGFAAFQKKAREEPFLADMRPGALVTDWILDAVLKSLHRVTGAGQVLLFPGTLGHWVASKARTQFAKVIGARRFIAALNVKGDHWVLLEGCPDEIVLYDSLPSHTSGDAAKTARGIAELSPLYAKTPVRSAKWLQQAPGSNDCAFFCMKAALMLMARHSQEQVKQSFSRAFVDKVLPHVPRAEMSRQLTFLDDRMRAEFGIAMTRQSCVCCHEPIYSDRRLQCVSCSQHWHEVCNGVDYSPDGQWRCGGCRPDANRPAVKPPARQSAPPSTKPPAAQPPLGPAQQSAPPAATSTEAKPPMGAMTKAPPASSVAAAPPKQAAPKPKTPPKTVTTNSTCRISGQLVSDAKACLRTVCKNANAQGNNVHQSDLSGLLEGPDDDLDDLRIRREGTAHRFMAAVYLLISNLKNLH